MSLKTLLMPVITQYRFSRNTLLAKRKRAEKNRVAAGRPHQVHYFHQVDDPYSHLMTQALSLFLARYPVQLTANVVSPPANSAAPERDKLISYSRRDAALLAAQHGLDFKDSGHQPDSAMQQLACHALVAAIQAGQFVELASEISRWLWTTNNSELVPAHIQTGNFLSQAAVQTHIAESDALRNRLGHYLGGMLYYEGEWYWGIDRLYHLEQRLRELGVQGKGISGPLFAMDDGLKSAQPLANPPDIDFFFSFRSPYSAIVAPRIFELGTLTGAKVNLRYVLPMVMRGLPVPAIKREYIVQDAAREAHVRGIPFGRLNDPVGLPTERGLALIPFAEQHSRGAEFVLSFMQGVWAEGIDAGSDKGLQRIVERAGLSWEGAEIALQHTAWREVAAANREALFEAGLWGVPSFKVGNFSTWGQDRLRAVYEALKAQEKT